MSALQNLLEKLKGSDRSGNYGHSGRPGKVGGSGPTSYLSPENATKIFAGKSGEEWMEEQQALSKSLFEREMKAYDEIDYPTEISKDQYRSHLNRLGRHRAMILDEAMKVAQKRIKHMPDSEQKELMDNLMKHDAEKYNFKIAEAYIGKKSVDKGTYEGAFWAAVSKHHLTNPHHWEHWVGTETIGGKQRKIAAAIPRVHFIEMMGDWNGTAREQGTEKDWYYKKFGDDFILHPDTRKAAEKELGLRK